MIKFQLIYHFMTYFFYKLGENLWDDLLHISSIIEYSYDFLIWWFIATSQYYKVK